MNSRSRSSTSGNLWSTPEARIAESNRRLLEEQNNEKTSDLADAISRLKHLSIDVNQEVVSQNHLLGTMDGQMGSSASLLDDTLTKLGGLLNTGESKHMLYLIIFVVGTFVVLYTYFVKLRSPDVEDTTGR